MILNKGYSEEIEGCKIEPFFSYCYEAEHFLLLDSSKLVLLCLYF